MPTKVFIQPEGAKHVFRRPGAAFSLDNIVERPERLRAVNCGLAAGLARLEAIQPAVEVEQHEQDQSDDLVRALEGLALGASAAGGSGSSSPAQPTVVFSAPAVGGLIRSKAVEFIHHPPSDDPGEVRYLDSLVSWVKTCEGKWATGESEIPAELPQLDLYLCRASLAAVEGALSTTIKAVDAVVADSKASTSNVFSNSAATAFCSIRPPGHHCGEDNPMGFCFVNNVAVGAAHAYLRHGIDRVVILDIDLHHGNGTQEIALRLNEDTYREELLVAGGKPAETKRGLKVFYGSVHDIYSFPCEDGNLERVKDASLNLAAHGQYIENIHLLPYSSPADFWARCYPRYTDLFARTVRFLTETDASPDRTLILVSAGFDACEHEGAGMQRHGGNVPVGFYERFHRDTVDFAVKHAKGRVVSVLEGGYGDRALASGAMASVVGLSALPPNLSPGQTEEWWSVPNLIKLEKALKRPSRRTTRAPNFSADDAWLQRTTEIFAELEAPFIPVLTAGSPAEGSRTTAVRTGERMMTRTRSGDKSLAGVLDSKEARPSGTNTPKEIKEEPELSQLPTQPTAPASGFSAPASAPPQSAASMPAPNDRSVQPPSFGKQMPAATPAEPTFAHLPLVNSSLASLVPPSGPVKPQRIILKFRNPMAQPPAAPALGPQPVLTPDSNEPKALPQP